VHLSGEDAVEETLRFARRRHVTKLVVGRPTRGRWRDLLRGAFLDRVVRGSQGLDVYVISGEGGALAPAREPTRLDSMWAGLAAAVVACAASTLVGLLFGRAQLPDVVMVYLLGIVFVSMRFGARASIFATVLSVLALDVVFIPPYLSFDVADLQHVVTFLVMFVVAIVISSLTRRTKEQADMARRREARTVVLYGLTRDLARATAIEDLVTRALSHVRDAFDADAAIFVPDAEARLGEAHAGSMSVGPGERAAVAWVWANGKMAGLGTDTLPSAGGLFVPLRGARGRVGVLGIRPKGARDLVEPDQRALLDAVSAQIGSALERDQLAAEAQRAQVQVETERMRSSLLSSVSHDLRTPLGVITGAASSLAEDRARLDAPARAELVDTIREEADRLSRLVGNLLEMTRVESGALAPKKEWQPLVEIVGVALNRLEERLRGRSVTVELPADLVPLDAVLVEQVFLNLLENAVRYTPAGSPLVISAQTEDGHVVIEVADRGPGVPEADRERVFEKFYRSGRSGDGGAGLGLAICRGIVEAHGGRIWVSPRDGGGARFRFILPIEGTPPAVGGGEST
jgi:two-component system sensor histidine kinase KdpD